MDYRCMGCYCIDHCQDKRCKDCCMYHQGVDRRRRRHSLEPKDRFALAVVYNPVRYSSGLGYHKTLETEVYQYQNNEIFTKIYLPLG